MDNIKVPISHTHYNEKIVNLLYEIYEKLYSTIDADRSLKDNNHLHFYLDEFGALPFDKRFLDYFYVHEEYNISSTISIQTLEVFYTKYGEKESLKLISDMGIIVILDNYSFKYDSIFQMIIKDKFQTDFMSEFLKEIPNDKTTLYEIMKENDCSDCVVYMPGYNLFLDKKYNY